jgi:hypothetical protein
MLNESRPFRAPLAAKVVLAAAAIGGVFLASACSSDTSPAQGTDGGNGASTSTGGKSGSGGSTSNGGSSTGGGSSSGGGTSSGGAGGMCTGGPVSGAADTHCQQSDGGLIKQSTGKCEKDSDAAAPPPAAGDAGGSDYGDTLYGTEGDDDDCKYHVVYTVPAICENKNVTFHATVTNTVDGKPTTGAYPYLEATLDDLPSASAVVQSYKETSPGVYDVGPLVFDRPGKWTVRFHFFEDCSDDPEDSPHGHIAFYIDVP